MFDVSGAGDTVISVLAMCLSVGLSFKEASEISNAAAGVVVGKRELPL
ncbi:PfkB family carbohydrate kinase [Brachyspira hyodysenteriae]|nr:PfkB family carbohydrate kinase [Brachyspira hyodysenteriae]